MKQLTKYLSLFLMMLMLIGVLSSPASAASSVKVPTVGSVTVTSTSAGKLTVKWKKVKNAYRYQIAIAQNSAFTKNVSKTLVKSTTSCKTFTNLKKGSKYYVKVRALKKKNGETFYGKYSKTKSCTVKKSSSSGNTSGSGSGTVYWTPSGSVYHSTRNCPTLSRSKTIRSGSVSQSGKLRKCKVCY